MIKKLVQKIVATLVRNSIAWNFLNSTILRVAKYIAWERYIFELDEKSLVEDICPDLTVKYGPFRGMVFPHSNFTYGAVIPKLLGCYERELHGCIERVCSSTSYSEIIDIGCAEGYYAVGLALRLENVSVIAFDIDENALKLTRELAEVNGVSDRIVLKKECFHDTLPDIPVKERALIICDCEGCEKSMFTKANVKLLTKHDFLIEVHDCVDMTISQHLSDVFKDTHNVEIIQSIDDIKKAQNYSYQELSKYDLDRKKMILSEKRVSAMEWIFVTRKL